MKRIATIVVFAFSVFTSKAQTFNPLLASMLQDTLNTYVSQISNIKGMSAGVYVPGQGIWKGVAGVSHSGQPITDDMRFGIASNSKLFTSVMMLILAESNVLSLEDPLSDWISVSNPNISPTITIRQLLNHTSGVSDPFFAAPWLDTINNNATRVFTPQEVLGWVGAPLFSAGTDWGYSNTNYVLAGMVAESASGYSLSTLIRDSILTPLNMDSTFIDVEEPVNGTLAHRWWNRIVNPTTLDYHDTSRVALNSAVSYAGSIFSTSSEMVQWYNALFDGQLLGQSSMDELTTFVSTANPNYQYGLGLSTDITQGYGYWEHGGRTWGYKSKMMHDTCLHVSVAGLTNSDPSGVDAVTFLLYRAVKNHIPGCSDDISGSVVVCAGTSSVTYTVPPIPNATSYSWSLPPGVTGISSSNSITLNFGASASSGTIKVTGINNYGPGGYSTLWVSVNPIPATPIIVQNGNVLSSSAPSGNQWYDANGMIQGATGQTYTITANGDYYCLVTLLNCSSAPSNSINATTTEVVETFELPELRIYPNPSMNQTTIETDILLNNAELLVTDCFGKTVIQLKNLNGRSFNLNRDKLESGLYFVQLIQNNRVTATNKLVLVD